MGIVDNCYKYTRELLMLQACVPETHQVYWPSYPSPVLSHNLLPFLRRHPDQEFAHYIIEGLSSGFRIGFMFNIAQLRSNPRNHPSSLENPTVIRTNINKELALG